MVNQKDTRSRLLDLLKNSDAPLSGEFLSGRLEISRVAVWKQMGRLEEMGYRVESSRKGYRLTGEPVDPLEAHLFSGRERFYCLEETGSTMDYAEKILHRNGREGDFVVTAEKQRSGRGRHNREWVSPKGGLFFTHSFSSRLPAPRCYQASMAALISLTEILREDYGQPAFIKWPNDILVNGKKIIGLLSAFSGEEERISRFSLGIGINVNNAPPLPGTTCSLSALTGRNLSRSDLMKRYLEKMNRYGREKSLPLTPLYNSLAESGALVNFELEGGEQLKDRTRGVDEAGALILNSGRRIFPGECRKTEKL